MPVFARTKMVIQDDCLTPRVPFVQIKYEGPNPQEVYEKIKELLVTVWKMEPGDIQERESSWERSTGTLKFSVKLECVKDLDTFSFYLVTVKIKGEAKHSRRFGMEGKVSVEFEPILRTEYPQDTLWQRSLIYEFVRMLWHKLIYQSRREKYLRDCRRLSEKFYEEIKSFLNLLPKSY